MVKNGTGEFNNATIQEKILSNISDIIVIINKKGVVTYKSPNVEKFFGWKPHELIGQLVWDNLHPEDLEPAKELFNTLMNKDNASGEIECRYKCKDGTYKWIRFNGTNLLKDPGINGILGNYHDITERKIAEEELFKERNLLRIVIDNLPDGIWTKDLNCRKTLANRANVLMDGHKSEDEVLGKDDYELFPMELAEEFMRDDLSVIQTGKPVINREEYVCDEKGQKHFLLTTKLPFPDEKGQMIGLIGISRDITERKLAEEEFKRSDSILKATLESMNEGLLIVDAEGIITHYNRRFKEIFSIPENLLTTKDDKRLISYVKDQLIDPDTFTGNIEKIYKSNESTEDLLYFKNSSIIERFSYCLPEGSPVKARVWLFRDITEKKQYEENLNKFKSATDNSMDGVFWLNKEGGFDYINERACKMLGYSYKELIQLKIPDIDPSISLETHKTNWERLIKNKRLEWYSLESTQKKKDSSLIPVEISSVFIWMDNNGLLISYVKDISERKKAEEELLRNQKLLTESQRIAQMGSWELDLNNHNLFWNEEAYRIYGYKYKEIKPNLELFTELVHPDDREKVKGHFEFTLKTKEFHDFECRIIQPDGKIVYIVVAGEIILDENANPVKTFGIVQDITERKLAIEELTKSAREKESLMKSMASAFVMWEPVFDMNNKIIDVRFSYINETYEKMTGITLDQVQGKRILEVWPDTELDWFDIFNEIIQTNSLKTFDKYFTPTDRYYSCNAYLPWNTHDRICVVFDDITERKQYEEALKKRVLALTRPLGDIKEIVFTELFNIDDLQKIQDTFAEATGVASIITYPDGTPITKPSNFCRLCNLIRSTEKGLANCYKSDAYIGKKNLVGPTIQPCISGGLWDAGASITLGGVHVANWLIGQVRNDKLDEEKMLKYAEEIGIEKDLYTKELNKVTRMSVEKFEKVAESLYILANELSLKAYQNVQQARFITEQKKSEEEIRKLNTELEARVEERTVQLKQANDELEAFAYSVSHDLRAPIRHINGFLQILQKVIKPMDSKVQEYFDKIEISSTNMSVMIDELLKFSRLGRTELHYQDVILSNIIEDIIDRFKPDYAKRKVQWTIRKLPPLKGDPVLLKIALENLISNAIKYTAKEEIAEIEIGESGTDNNSVTFYVKDNGVGFDMTYKDKLFGVFQRLHNQKEFEGVGIGLANVKQIISKHNGSITVESKINEGTTFYISLPK